jgi:putative DNA primase/helicase
MTASRPRFDTEAILCAKRGWHVFPCSPADKKPLTEHGLKDATRDSATIKRWWTQWPRAMIGIRTGPESGFFAIDLDLDPEKKLNGVAAFEMLKNGGELPETITAQTPRGGRHLWFRWVDGIKNSAGKVAPGIDVRGAGGYVIAPPSRRADGAEYQFLADDWDGPAEAPSWLLELILPKKQEEASRKTAAGNGADTNYARAALDRECAAVTSAQPGGRNNTLNRSAFNLGQLVAGGALSESEVSDRLYSAATTCGLVKDDGCEMVEKTIASGLAAGMAKPRSALVREAKAPGPSAKPRKKKSEKSAGIEDRVALEFAQQHANDFRYVAASSQWMRWSESRWETENTLAAFDESRKLCRKAGNAKAKTVAAVIALARADRTIAATMDQWDRDPWCLNTDATYDLRTGIARAPNPLDYLTKKTVCDAAPAGTPHPMWDAFLARITADDIELQQFLQRYIGYSCTGFTQEQVFVFAYGQGANGKGTFINTLSKIFGDYATIADMNIFLVTRNERHPTDLAKLRGARLVIAQETQKGRRWDETKIKALTGGDKITARFMRQDYFDFEPTFKLFIAGNHKPRLSTIDEAMRRRMLVVPFTVQIPPLERDRHLPDKLWSSERAAILRWCIDGCLEWQRIGLAPPNSVRKTTDEYFDDQDNLGQWIEECANPEAGIFGFELSSVLFDSWREWCTRQNLNPGSEKSFVEALRDRGFERSRKEHGRGFAGISLKGG